MPLMCQPLPLVCTQEALERETQQRAALQRQLSEAVAAGAAAAQAAGTALAAARADAAREQAQLRREVDAAALRADGMVARLSDSQDAIKVMRVETVGSRRISRTAHKTLTVMARCTAAATT